MPNAEDSLVLDRLAARRFTEVREALGLSQSDIVRAAAARGKTDWSRNTVHAIERFGYVRARSGTRRLTLTELFEFPALLEKACEMKGVPYVKVHPAWFLMAEQKPRKQTRREQQQQEVAA